MHRGRRARIAGRPTIRSLSPLFFEIGDLFLAEKLATFEALGALERRQRAVVPDALQVGVTPGGEWSRPAGGRIGRGRLRIRSRITGQAEKNGCYEAHSTHRRVR